MSAVKALQQWCRVQCQGYRDVSITNMTTSFRDGLAFCALIHKHRPDLINFESLKKENVYENNKLAFKVAEEELGIPALLDAEDMVALRVPDRLSILTYVSQYYNYFHGRSPIGGMGGIKRPAEGPTEEPSGKKNLPVNSKVFPSSNPARENSPPPSSYSRRPPPSPRQTRNTAQDVLVEKSNQTGTLSNKCVSCQKHVHLVQRHLVDGKLYHRSCAKSLSPTGTSVPFKDFPANTPVFKLTPPPDSTKTSTNPSSHNSTRLGPTWLTEKPSSPPSFSSNSSTPSPSLPASSLSSAVKDSQTTVVPKPRAPRTTSESTFNTTVSITTTPTPAPRTSATAAKTVQSKLKFFASDNTANNDKTTITNTNKNKGSIVTGKVQQAAVGQAVSVVVNIGGTDKKEKDMKLNTSEEKNKVTAAAGESSKVYENSKMKAAAFISKKLAEEKNDSNSKKTSVTIELKTTDTPSQAETAKKQPEGVRSRVKLRADPSLLADLQRPDTSNLAPSPTPRSGLRDRSPDRGVSKPFTAVANTSVSESESPADWRSKLKPVSRETKPAAPPQSSHKLWANGAGKSQTSEISVGSSPSPHLSNISDTPSAPKGLLNDQEEKNENGTKPESKICKTKPDYICKEDLLKELQEIEDNLNELEKRGVELEVKLRTCEEEGEDDSLMDGLMVEWFNLIRNKQVAIRRESELVYIGRSQDLEEQQPSVEQELRRLMEKPEHLKTAWHRKREKELMEKLVEIVNDRNAIVEGLDEDRIREEEEDEQLNEMMKNFNIKKDNKPKKKSPVSKLFRWGSKKEE